MLIKNLAHLNYADLKEDFIVAINTNNYLEYNYIMI